MRLKVGYTDLQKCADGMYRAKLTAEISGGRGDEQVQFWIDLDPIGAEISVDEFGHAQTHASGLSGNSHRLKAALIDSFGHIIIGTEVSCQMDLTRSPKLADKLHVRATGRGRVFVLVAVQAQDGSPVKGAVVNIYEAGESLHHGMRTVPLFTGETNMHGALERTPYFDVLPIHGKRIVLVHVAGTKLEEFVVCRPAEHHRSLKQEDFDKEILRATQNKMFGTRLIRAFFAGWRLGGEELRRQEKEAQSDAFH